MPINRKSDQVKFSQKELYKLRHYSILTPYFDDFYCSGVQIKEKLLEAMGIKTYDLSVLKKEERSLDGTKIELSLPHNSDGIYIKSKPKMNWLYINVKTINMYENTKIQFIQGESYIHKKFYQDFKSYFSL